LELLLPQEEGTTEEPGRWFLKDRSLNHLEILYFVSAIGNSIGSDPQFPTRKREITCHMIWKYRQ
jgi:hypothetical protein